MRKNRTVARISKLMSCMLILLLLGTAYGRQAQEQKLVLLYKPVGTHKTDHVEMVESAYAEQKGLPAPEYDMEIYESSLPAGITMKGGTISVDDGIYKIFGYVKIAAKIKGGRYKGTYSEEVAMSNEQMRGELLKVGKILDADIMCVIAQDTIGSKIASLYAIAVREVEVKIEVIGY